MQGVCRNSTEQSTRGSLSLHALQGNEKPMKREAMAVDLYGMGDIALVTGYTPIANNRMAIGSPTRIIKFPPFHQHSPTATCWIATSPDRLLAHFSRLTPHPAWGPEDGANISHRSQYPRRLSPGTVAHVCLRGVEDSGKRPHALS